MTATGRTPGGLAYEVAGSGPALLLLHAGLTDRRMWDPQLERLARRFTVIRYDARGFGDSDDPRRRYTMHGDALEVLDALAIARAALCGVSVGGEAALDLAIATPHRVAALVAVSAAPSGWRHSPELLNALDGIEVAAETRGLDTANELELRTWLDGPFRPAGDVDRDLRRAIASTNRVLLERQAGTADLLGGLEPPAAGRLDEVRCPVLVITGELDQPSVLAGAFELARATGGKHVEIAGAGHLPNLERPAEFCATVERFLAAQAPW